MMATPDLSAAVHDLKPGVTCSRPTPLSPQATLQRLFANLFEIDTVTPDDDFFHLGGDSLVAQRLMLAIEREFGVGLSISVLVEACSPRALSAVIEESQRRKTTSLLSSARGNLGQLPIYCVHGTRGTSLFPRQIADVMQGRHGIYGLRAPGLEVGERPMLSVPSMATHYARLIPQEEPCVLLGHCGGATIAYEMARQRLASGKPLAGLILIDPEVSHATASFLHQRSLGMMARRIRGTLQGVLIARAVRNGNAGSNDERHDLVYGAINIAVGRYRPKPLDCRALFLYTPERESTLLDPRRGYQRLLPHATFRQINAVHEQMFSRGIVSIVCAIQDFLDQIPADAASHSTTA
jgi:thioesterase domain-containing protein/acyl carrier protein